MKNQLKYTLKLILICTLITIFGCEKDLYEDNIIKSNKETVSYVKINDVPFLIPTIIKYNKNYSYLNNFSKSDGEAKSELLNLDLEHILKYVAVDGKETYSIVIKEEFEEFENVYFKNLHIWMQDAEYKSGILKYDAIDDNKKYDPLTFTGIVEIQNLEDEYQGEVQMLNGKLECVKIPVGCWTIIIMSDGNFGVRNDCEGSSGGGSANDNGSSGPGNDSGGSYPGTGGSYGGTPSSGGSNPGGTTPTGNDPTLVVHNPVVPNVPVWPDPELTSTFSMARLLRIELNLTTDDQAWLRNNPTVTNRIYSHLFENFYFDENTANDNEARLFVKNTILALRNNGSILNPNEFDDHITPNLPPCLTNVVNGLKTLPNGKFGQVIAQFSGTNPVPLSYNWTINTASLGPNVIAQTNPTIQGGVAITTINSDFTNISTDLSIAKTLIHECFHAYLNNVYRYRNLDVSYATLVNQYSSQFNNNANDIHHHVYTINNIVNEISLALKDYGVSKGYNLPQQFYDDMAWGGLYGTQVYNALPQSQRDRIESTIEAEFRNSNNSPGNVLGINPRGTRICP